MSFSSLKEINEKSTKSKETTTKKLALFINPSIILSALEEAVKQIISDGKRKIKEKYQKLATDEDADIQKKHWYRMIDNEKEIQSIIKAFGVFLATSDALLVPQHLLCTIKKAMKETDESPSDNQKEEAVPAIPRNVVPCREDDPATEALMKELQCKADAENELLQEKTKLEATIQAKKRSIILKIQQHKYVTQKLNQLKIGPLLCAPELDKEKLFMDDLDRYEGIERQYTRLRKNSEILDSYKRRLISFPPVNLSEEDPQNVLMKHFGNRWNFRDAFESGNIRSNVDIRQPNGAVLKRISSDALFGYTVHTNSTGRQDKGLEEGRKRHATEEENVASQPETMKNEIDLCLEEEEDDAFLEACVAKVR